MFTVFTLRRKYVNCTCARIITKRNCTYTHTLAVVWDRIADDVWSKCIMSWLTHTHTCECAHIYMSTPQSYTPHRSVWRSMCAVVSFLPRRAAINCFVYEQVFLWFVRTWTRMSVCASCMWAWNAALHPSFKSSNKIANKKHDVNTVSSFKQIQNVVNSFSALFSTMLKQ